MTLKDEGLSSTGPTTPRGFAAMDKDLHREIASKGGLSAQRSQRAHRFSPEEASRAGKLSADARAETKRAFLAALTEPTFPDSARAPVLNTAIK